MISVIMATYNNANLICIALESINKQSLDDVELIVCDDCSTDGTWELLQQVKEKFNISILLRNPINKGLAYSLNRCIQYSHGDYIARMDADDWCECNRLEKELVFLKNHKEYDLVGTLCMFVYDDDKKYKFKKPEIPDKSILPLKNPFIHPTIMIRRYALDKLGGYTVSTHTRRCEDLDLWYRFFELGLKGYNIQEYLYYKKQSIDNYKKRTVKDSINIFFTHINGIKRLNMKWYKYLLAIKPILSSIIPNRIMILYHRTIFGQIKG